jgi:hypothetical protein
MCAIQHKMMINTLPCAGWQDGGVGVDSEDLQCVAANQEHVDKGIRTGYKNQRF